MDAMKKEIVYNLGLVYEQMGDRGEIGRLHEADLRGRLRLQRRGCASGKFLPAGVATELISNFVRH